MNKFLATAGAVALMATAATAGQPDAPGAKGHNRAIETNGFARSIEAQGGGFEVTVDRAADIYGNNGKGNGADPDFAGGLVGDPGGTVAEDHDPNNFGGAPDTDR